MPSAPVQRPTADQDQQARKDSEMTVQTLTSARVLGSVALVLAASSNWASAAVVFVCVTPTHRIEVSTPGGTDVYEYRAWKLNKKGDDPALSLRGSMDVQGTGECRTRYWTFRNGKYEYVISDSVNCGERMPPAEAIGQLTVSLSGNQISDSWCRGEGGRPGASASAPQVRGAGSQQLPPQQIGNTRPVSNAR